MTEEKERQILYDAIKFDKNVIEIAQKLEMPKIFVFRLVILSLLEVSLVLFSIMVLVYPGKTGIEFSNVLLSIIFAGLAVANFADIWEMISIRKLIKHYNYKPGDKTIRAVRQLEQYVVSRN
jgi:hypothetical protein